MALDPGVVDAVTNSNFKNVAEAPAFYAGLAMGDAVAHQRAVNAVREAALAAALKNFADIDPLEAVSALKVISGNDLAQQLSAMGSAIAQIQQLMKGAQTTPPPTA